MGSFVATIKKTRTLISQRPCSSSGGRTRTSGLRVMSPTSYQLLYPAMLLDYKGKHYFWFCKLLLNFFYFFPVTTMKVTTMRVMITPAMILNVRDSPKKMVPTVIDFRTGRLGVERKSLAIR